MTTAISNRSNLYRRRATTDRARNGSDRKLQFVPPQDGVLLMESGSTISKDAITITLEATSDKPELSGEVLRYLFLNLDAEPNWRRATDRTRLERLPELRVRYRNRYIPYWQLMFQEIDGINPYVRRQLLTDALSDLQTAVSLEDFIAANIDVDFTVNREKRTITVYGDLAEIPGRSRLLPEKVSITRSYDTGLVVKRDLGLT